jgi:hypothetical protein
MQRTIWTILHVAAHLLGAIYASISYGAQEIAPVPPQPQALPDRTGAVQAPSRTPTIVPTERRIVADALPEPNLTSGFGSPDNLRTPMGRLLPALGFGPAHCFPLTPSTCFEVAYKCYCQRLYEDALAFTNHGLKQSNDSRLYLLKAVCLMHLGDCAGAESTIRMYRSALAVPANAGGLRSALTLVNDPMRVRLEYLLNSLD